MTCIPKYLDSIAGITPADTKQYSIIQDLRPELIAGSSKCFLAGTADSNFDDSPNARFHNYHDHSGVFSYPGYETRNDRWFVQMLAC